MKELSLNILDITENSVSAKATDISVSLVENTKEDKLIIEIADNGCGMSAEFQKNVLNPFTTTRTTRKVGLGLPLLLLAAQQTGGDLKLLSEEGRGTTVTATFGLTHIDRAPIGDMPGTVMSLIQGHANLHFTFIFSKDGQTETLDTDELREQLGDTPLNLPEVLVWVKDCVSDIMTQLQFIN